MTCLERDPDLLLLAHNTLPWAQKLRTRAHLWGCRACRTRLAQLTHISALLASEVRGPGMPPWPRPQAVSRISQPSLYWQTALVLAALLVVLSVGTLISQRLASRSPGVGGVNAPAPDGCRPDLPNSRCR